MKKISLIETEDVVIEPKLDESIPESMQDILREISEKIKEVKRATNKSLKDAQLGMREMERKRKRLGVEDMDFMREDSRVETNASGEAVLSFKKAYSRKPLVKAMPEGDYYSYIKSYQTNASGNYTGVTVQLKDNSGSASGSGVGAHIFVRERK